MTSPPSPHISKAAAAEKLRNFVSPSMRVHLCRGDEVDVREYRGASVLAREYGWAVVSAESLPPRRNDLLLVVRR